jgi:glycerol-3-phosphate cytidylyltransferase
MLPKNKEHPKMRLRMSKIILTYGTFDLFHIGHVRMLKRLKNIGDKLIVGISTDEFNEVKGKKSFFSYEERSEIVSSCKFVDGIFPENKWDQKKNDIIRFNANVFAIGDDWKGKFDDLGIVCEVLYLPRTEDISTTDIKKSLAGINDDVLDKLEGSVHDVLEIVRALTKS